MDGRFRRVRFFCAYGLKPVQDSELSRSADLCSCDMGLCLGWGLRYGAQYFHGRTHVDDSKPHGMLGPAGSSAKATMKGDLLVEE